MSFVVDTNESFQDVLSCLGEGMKFEPLKGNLYKIGNDSIEFTKEYQDKLDMHDIIYGINKESNIVNISVDESAGLVYIFKETPKGVTHTTVEYKHWVLFQEQHNKSIIPLSGGQPYRFFKEYTLEELAAIRKKLYHLRMYTVYNKPENFMIRNGFTYFKDMKSKDVSILSFDIETTGLDPFASDAKLLLITNTFRKFDKYESRTFSVDRYENEADMIADWCAWVQEKDPSILLGHNIVMFDIPYIKARANAFNKELNLGRTGKDLIIDDKPRELRKDGSQTYTYHRIGCFGREIVDTFFLAIKADIARKYESYGLKSIIKQEGMEEAGREFYDASKIGKNWHIPEERAKIIAYAEADSRDPIKLYDLMIGPFFYLTPYIPKPFQIMIESATGSQLNALMVRSYLQKGMSVAAPSESDAFEGAISFGNCGVYDNVFKVDVASLYPSIMRHYKVYPKAKDYNSHFLKMLDYFTEERLKNKKKAKELKDRFYDDLQNAQKVVINSAYGFMGASGLNYNFPEGAASVTRYGREIISKAVLWATGCNLAHVVKKITNKGKPNEEKEYEWVIGEKVTEGKGYVISNCDTDSISFTCGKDLSLEERKDILTDLNGNFPSAIKFEDDGYYSRVVILKAKNYILKTQDGKIKLKGSSIRDQKKEPAIREMMEKMIGCLVNDSRENIIGIYNDYIRETHKVKDISRWAAKKTITKAILNCADDPEARLNERKVYEAVKNMPGLQEGNKVYIYPCIKSIKDEVSYSANGKMKVKVIKDTGLKIVEQWCRDEDAEKLVQRVVDTMDIFANVLNRDEFIDYTLVRNKKLLTALLN